MAFNLFKWFTTGNGDDDAPAPKPSPKASTPAPSSRPSAPKPRSSQWDQYVNQTPTTRTPGIAAARPTEDQSRARDLRNEGYGSALSNPVAAAQAANSVWGESLGAVLDGRGDEPATELRSARALTPPTDPALKPQYDAAQSRSNYDAALGSNSLSDVRELTWDQYNALTPRARAAVDANTALVSAVRQDLAAGQNLEAADDTYLQGVEALFGKQGGSDTYAPATMQALSQLGLGNTETGDLDQYLRGGALLTEDDLGQLTEQNFAGYTGTDSRVKNALALSERALSGINAQLQSGSTGYDPVDATDIDQFLDSLALRSNQQIFQEDPAQVGQLVGLFLDEHPNLTPESFGQYFEDRINRYDYSMAQGLPASLGSGSADLYINPSELRSLVFSKGGQ